MLARCTTVLQGTDQPFVVTNNTCNVLTSRQTLCEAVLRLEQQHHARMLVGTTELQGTDQPLVVTSASHSVLRSRQTLYEAVLRLEQQQVEVVERAIRDCDIILNASTCVCIWTEAQLLQVKLVIVSFMFCCLHDSQELFQQIAMTFVTVVVVALFPSLHIIIRMTRRSYLW